MNNDYPEDKERYNRLDTDLSKPDPADVDASDDNDIERRDRLTSIIDSVEPQPKQWSEADAVYADTDLNPHADDQKDAHRGSSDDIA